MSSSSSSSSDARRVREQLEKKQHLTKKQTKLQGDVERVVTKISDLKIEIENNKNLIDQYHDLPVKTRVSPDKVESLRATTEAQTIAESDLNQAQVLLKKYDQELASCIYELEQLEDLQP